MADEEKTPEQLTAEKAEADAQTALEAAKAVGTGTRTLDAAEAELAETRAALKAANKEAGDRRKRLAELEKAEEERQAASLTELQKEQKARADAEEKAAKAEAKARDMLIRAAFVAEGAKAGMTHPEDAYRLADLSGVDVNDVGAVEGAAEAVKALVDAGRVPVSGTRPAPNLDGGAGGGNRSNEKPTLNADQVAIAKKLGITADDYAKSLQNTKAAATA